MLEPLACICLVLVAADGLDECPGRSRVVIFIVAPPRRVGTTRCRRRWRNSRTPSAPFFRRFPESFSSSLSETQHQPFLPTLHTPPLRQPIPADKPKSGRGRSPPDHSSHGRSNPPRPPRAVRAYRCGGRGRSALRILATDSRAPICGLHQTGRSPSSSWRFPRTPTTCARRCPGRPPPHHSGARP